MSAYLDEVYFEWLYRQATLVRLKNPKHTHRNLLHILYTKEYVWLVPNDDNRVEDGKDLRYEFLEHQGIRVSEKDRLWVELGCSMLEFLIALSRRAAFETDRNTQSWFWELIKNLELFHLSDQVEFSREEVDDILDRVIWRTYHYNGGGGLFPLLYPERDQRKTEVWYQLNAYILERV